MKRNFIIIIALIALSLSAYNCGGGGAGPTNVPTGENSTVPSVLQLQPAQYVAQTGSSIYIKAKVLDGNGKPVPDTAVAFKITAYTNTSGTPSLSSATATTDSLGLASTTLLSATSGYVTVQASVSSTTASGSTAAQLLSKKTVYYSDYTLTCSSSGTDIYGSGCTQTTTTTTTPYMTLEPDTSSLLTASNKTDANITATVYTAYNGSVVSGTSVSFTSDSTQVTFPFGSTNKTTNDKGQVTVLARAKSSGISTQAQVVNITATAANGASKMISLTLGPVTVTGISLVAASNSIATFATDNITAIVNTSDGAYAPDATTVNFSALCGSDPALITAFAQTTSGAANAVFTAPSYAATCTVTAKSSGASNTTDIKVYSSAKLAVSPTAMSMSSGDTATFTITGGTPGYTITSSNPSFQPSPSSVTTSGGTFSVTAQSVNAATTVTYTITDAVGATASATLDISPSAASFYLLPNTATITVGGSITIYIKGGTATYTIITDSNAADLNYTGGNSFTVTGANTGTANITVQDSKGKVATGTVTVQ